MKFGKEFASQMVPEWQEAYMDYSFLKTLVKEIDRRKLRQPAGGAASTSGGLKRKVSLYRAFSGLTQRRADPGSPDVESQAILVSSPGGGGAAETTFLAAAEEGGEYELVYFRRLDDEFNKVERFYRGKVGEVVKEAEMLDKQMDALIAFRIKVESPPGVFDRTAEMTRLASDVAVSAAAVAASTPLGARRSASTRLSASRKIQMDIIEEGPSMHERGEEDSIQEQEQDQDQETVHRQKPPIPKPAMDIVPTRIAPMEVLGNVKMHNHLETPRSTIKKVLKVPRHTELNFTRDNLRKVEDQLTRAFVEFYQKLRLLKSFSFLNTLAFSKIMKKYDKVTSRTASRQYMRMVDSSYLGSSEEVTKLMERVEATFIKHFSNSNRTKGMNVLRPKAKRERHRTTFSMGFFAGCTSALCIALILLIRARKIMEHEKADQYMNTMFPLYSLFGFIVLHLVLYAIDIYFWRRYRVNYAFIFGFKQGTELGYRQVLMVAFGIAVLALCSVLSNLDMEMDNKTKDYKAFTELVPLNLVVFIFVILFLPLNVLYKSSRYFFLTSLYHCVAAPLFKVTLPDFFLGDQLTSQVQAFRSLEFYACYYGWGDYKHRTAHCKSHAVYNTFNFIVAVIPYWVRLLQCLRRLYEEKNREQGWNGLKYLLTVVAVVLRTAYGDNKGSVALRVLSGVVSGAAAVYCTWWDFIHDWGVLDRRSKNWLLRDKLLVPHKKVYYVAMVSNVFLRFAWLQTVLNFNIGSLHGQTTTTIVASLEIIRRGVWNFFRIENEHLNNVGKYRAFKSVPLPFNYDEDDDKEE